MARGQSVERAMDVVFLVPSATAEPASAVRSLQAQLRAQGIQLASCILIQDADPGAARSALLAAVRGPAPATNDPRGEPLPLALLAADIVVNAPPLGAVLDDPRIRSGGLSVRQGAGQAQLGVLKLAGADRATAAAELAGLPLDPLDPVDQAGDVLLQLTEALTAAGAEIQPVPLGGYRWARRAAGSAATDQVRALDERTVRLREAARGGDGFYSTFVLRRLSWRLTGLAERTGLTPNQVTLISFGLGLLAAGFLALGSRPWAIAGALLLQVCLVVDCVDGELARYRRRFSRFGAWLDATTDRVKEFATIGALALGGVVVADGRQPGRLLWALAAAAIAVQTFRNLFDLGWALQRSAAVPPVAGVVDRPAGVDWVAPASAGPLSSPRPVGPGAASWLRRIGHFPIGERFLLISLGAAFWSARGTLTVLLLAGLLSAGYQLAAFAVRSGSSSASSQRFAVLADTGPFLGALVRRLGGDRAGRLAVLLPAGLAIAELGLIWLFAVPVGGARRSAAVLLIAVTAIAHYQHAYGVREASVARPGGAALIFGTDLRLSALFLGVVLPAFWLSPTTGQTWATAAVWAIAGLVAVSSTARSLRVWTGSGGRSGHAGGTPPAGGAFEYGKTHQVGDTPPAAVGSTPAALGQAIGGVR